MPRARAGRIIAGGLGLAADAASPSREDNCGWIAAFCLSPWARRRRHEPKEKGRKRLWVDNTK